MEIVTKAQEIEEFPALALEFGFAHGGLTTYTILPEDDFTVTDKAFLITISMDGGSAKQVEIQKAHVAFWSRQDIIVKRRLKKQSPVGLGQA